MIPVEIIMVVENRLLLMDCIPVIWKLFSIYANEIDFNVLMVNILK